MADENRFCAHCDQRVDNIPDGKEWTTRSGEKGAFKHIKSAEEGVPGCGRQFLTEAETYTEVDH